MWDPYDGKNNLPYDAFDKNSALGYLKYQNAYQKYQDGDGQSFRMQVPKWQPGEFEEWKQAHMLNMPTQYGLRAQRAFNSRQFPKMQQYNEAGLTGNVVNPALMALMKGIR